MKQTYSIFLIVLSCLVLASCSNKSKKFSKNGDQISMTIVCKGELDEIPEPGDTLFVSDRNGILSIYRPHYITSTHRDFIPTFEIYGDTLYVSDTNTHMCYCQSEFETEYRISNIPYGKYVLIFGVQNMKQFQERKEEFSDYEMDFPAIEIDFKPNMQPITILERPNKCLYGEDPETDTTYVWIITEKMPEFPRGTEAFFKYIETKTMTVDSLNSTKRPIVQFIVERDGSLSNIEVVRSCGIEELDKDAISVVENMPKWKPGKVRGIPVRVKYTIPINYRPKK